MKEMKYFITATCKLCNNRIKFWNTELAVNRQRKPEKCDCEYIIDEYEIKEWSFEF